PLNLTRYNLIYNLRVQQGRGIAHIIQISLCDFSENPPHNFSRSGLGEPGHNLNFVRSCNGSYTVGDREFDFIDEVSFCSVVQVTDNEGINTLAFDFMRITYNRGFYDPWMFVDRIFHFSS